MHLKIQQRGNRTYLSVVQSYREGARVRTRTVETIGYTDQFDGTRDQVIARFREHVAQLNRQRSAGRAPVTLSFDPGQQVTPQPDARLGVAIALGCLDALGTSRLLPTREARALELLAAERMLHVTTKRETWSQRASFPRSCQLTLEQLYAALPAIASTQRRLPGQVRTATERIAGPLDLRTVTVVLGTYRFPAADEHGNRSHVQAHLAVALDALGMPAGYRVALGPLGPRKLHDLASGLKRELNARRAIVVAGQLDQDQAQRVMSQLTASGNGFVLYQPVVDAAPDLRTWIDDPRGFWASPDGTLRMKSRTTYRALDDGQAPVRELVLAGSGYTLHQATTCLVTSELDMPGAAVVQLFRELWRQAEPFQVLEADFAPLPWPVGTHDHARAHFAICYTAFSALRLLRWKMGWSHNAAQVADALLRMQGVPLQQGYCLFTHRSPVSDAIEGALELPQAQRLQTRRQLRSVPRLVAEALAGEGAEGA